MTSRYFYYVHATGLIEELQWQTYQKESAQFYSRRGKLSGLKNVVVASAGLHVELANEKSDGRPACSSVRSGKIPMQLIGLSVLLYHLVSGGSEFMRSIL